jgi:hypothetical protein
MRIIAILAATSITFVAALPLSTVANAVTIRQCDARFLSCIQACIGKVEEFRLRADWTPEADEGFVASIEQWCVPPCRGGRTMCNDSAVIERKKPRLGLRPIPDAALRATGPSFSQQGPVAKAATGRTVQLAQDLHCREGYVAIVDLDKRGHIMRHCVLRKGSWLEYKDQRNYQGNWYWGQGGRWDDRRGSSWHP